MKKDHLCKICGQVPALLQHDHVDGPEAGRCTYPKCPLPASVVHDHVERNQHTRGHLTGTRCPICGIAAVIDHVHVGSAPPIVNDGNDASLQALRRPPPTTTPALPVAPPPNEEESERELVSGADDDEIDSDEHERPTLETLG